MEADEQVISKRWILFFFSGMILYTVLYSLFFVELQRLAFDHKGTFLFSGPNYGLLVAVLATLQSPFAVLLLDQILKGHRSRMRIVFGIICGLLSLPPILLFPFYRSVDASGIHKGQFYGVEKTISWSEMSVYDFDPYRTMKGTYVVKVGFALIDHPSHPLFITLPISDSGARSAFEIQSAARKHHLPDVTHQYPAGSHFLAVLASSSGNTWSEFVHEEFMSH